VSGKPRGAAGQPVLLPPPLPQGEVLTAPVLNIVDGDTIDVRLDGRAIRVGSISVNTSETAHAAKGVEPLGQEAGEANRRWVEGKTVRRELDGEKYDQYRRRLASVSVGETMVTAELVR
jgi:micrococcal nuclease